MTVPLASLTLLATDSPTAAREAIIRQALAPLLFGSYGNACLFTFECLFIVHIFFFTKRAYSKPMKFTLGALWAIDTAGTIAAFANLWQPPHRPQPWRLSEWRADISPGGIADGITHWGDNDFVTRQYWPMIVYVVTSSLSGAIVQAVLAGRYWALSKNLPACLLIAACWLAALVGGLVSAVWIALFPDYRSRGALTAPVTIYLVGAVATDCTIALLLVYKLWLARRQVARFESSNLVRPLERLIRTSIETGAATALLAVAALVSYLAAKESNLSPCFGELLGRTYALTLLFILLQRRALSDDVERRPTRRRFAFPKLSGSPQASAHSSSGGSKRHRSLNPAGLAIAVPRKEVRFVSPAPTPLELQEFAESMQGTRGALSPSLFTLGSFSERDGDVDEVEKGEYGAGESL